MNARRVSILLAALALAAGGLATAAWADDGGSGSSGPGNGGATTTVTTDGGDDHGHDGTTTATTTAAQPSPAPTTTAASAPGSQPRVAQPSKSAGPAAATGTRTLHSATRSARSWRRTSAAALRHGLGAVTTAHRPRKRAGADPATPRASDGESLAFAHDDPPGASAPLLNERLAQWIAFVVLGVIVVTALLLGAGIWAKRRVVKL
jgi:hypothetical protein